MKCAQCQRGFSDSKPVFVTTAEGDVKVQRYETPPICRPCEGIAREAKRRQFNNSTAPTINSTVPGLPVTYRYDKDAHRIAPLPKTETRYDPETIEVFRRHVQQGGSLVMVQK